MKLSQLPDTAFDAFAVFAALCGDAEPLREALLVNAEKEAGEPLAFGDDLLDALVVAALRTPSDVEEVQVELDAGDQVALNNLSDGLVESVMRAVETRRTRPVLFFEQPADFKTAFQRLAEWGAVGSRSVPHLIEASRPLTEEELAQLPGCQLIDHSSEIGGLPKAARLHIRSLLRLMPSSAPLRGEGAKWDAPGFTPPDSH